MLVVLGIALLGAGLWLLLAAYRLRRGPEALRPARRRRLAGAAASLAAGLFCVAWPRIALANLRPVDLVGRKDNWRAAFDLSDTSPIHWEGDALVASLEAGSGHYAVYPVDWKGDRFEAEFDLTFTRLDPPAMEFMLNRDGRPVPARRSPLEYGSVAIGIMDQNVVSIDDRDHVSGSAIQACFSTDIRLRASDSNYIVRTSSSTESGRAQVDPDFRKSAPVRIELNRRYRCRLAYDGPRNEAELHVTDEEGRPVARRRLEDLKEFTNSLSWFGVSVRGFNRFNKLLDATKAQNGYSRPVAVVRIENLRYRQPM